VPGLVQVQELVPGLELVQVPGLVQELVQELVPGRHKPLSTRSPRPLPSPKPLFVFYSFSPPKILESSIKNISLRKSSPPFVSWVCYPQISG